MSKSTIEWTDDTWNPVSGCTRVSAGCDNCYAVKMTKRLEAMGQEKYTGLVNIGKGHFNGVVKTHEDVLTIPLKVRKPRRYFVNSMSDLFHRDVPLEFINKVFAVMALCPQHTFQILTKRPERMAEYMNLPCPIKVRPRWCDAVRQMVSDKVLPLYDDGFSHNLAEAWVNRLGVSLASPFIVDYPDKPLRNVWLGTSVEDQQTADERIPHLLKCPAAVRFLSCEPLLGPVDLTRLPVGRNFIDCLRCDFHGGQGSVIAGPPSGTGPVDWVIVGGESGPGARPMHPDWARSLRDQCVAAGVPYFFKQWGGVDKKSTGRIIDGRTWDEFPVVKQ